MRYWSSSRETLLVRYICRNFVISWSRVWQFWHYIMGLHMQALGLISDSGEWIYYRNKKCTRGDGDRLQEGLWFLDWDLSIEVRFNRVVVDGKGKTRRISFFLFFLSGIKFNYSQKRKGNVKSVIEEAARLFKIVSFK